MRSSPRVTRAAGCAGRLWRPGCGAPRPEGLPVTRRQRVLLCLGACGRAAAPRARFPWLLGLGEAPAASGSASAHSDGNKPSSRGWGQLINRSCRYKALRNSPAHSGCSVNMNVSVTAVTVTFEIMGRMEGRIKSPSGGKFRMHAPACSLEPVTGLAFHGSVFLADREHGRRSALVFPAIARDQGCAAQGREGG